MNLRGFNMHYFGKCLLVLCCTMSLGQADKALAEDEPRRTIVGYSSELSVRPGDTIEFMVNSEQVGKYKADLVRVINGESQSIYGDQFKVEHTASTFEGTYEGKPQKLNPGSYIHISNTSALDKLKSLPRQ